MANHRWVGKCTDFILMETNYYVGKILPFDYSPNWLSKGE
jgi:hypothetical protein